MKIAKVTYEGNVRNKTHRGPSGRVYQFGHDNPGLDSIPDVEFFDEKPNYTVEWTALGQLKRRYSDDYEDLKSAIKEMGYRQKQKLAKTVGIKANQGEDELDEALEEYAEELQNQMEHQ